MAEVKIALLPTGMTYSRNTKAPLEDKRIFTTLALAQEYVNDIDQTAYVGLTISVVNDGANNGLYYVDRIADENNATGLLVKVGSDTASDVASLQTDVTSIKTTIGDTTSGLIADVNANTAAISTKADIFTVGNGLSYSKNKINVVVSTAEGNSLSISEDGLYVSVPEVKVPVYDIVKSESAESGDAATYYLTKDGIRTGSKINIPLDQVLKSAEILVVSDTDVPYTGAKIGDKYIKFTFQNNENNPQYLPVQDLVDIYTGGDYITVNDDNTIDFQAATFAQELDNQFGLTTLSSNVSTLTADLVNANTAISNVDEKATNAIGLANTNKTNIETLTANLAEVKVKDIDDVVSYGVGLTLNDDKIKVNVDLDTLAAAVIAKHDVPAPIAANISVADFGTYKNSNVQAVLESLDTRITAAAAGGVQTIVANPGSGITVDSDDVNNPAISINVVEGSSLKINEDNKLDLVWSEL